MANKPGKTIASKVITNMILVIVVLVVCFVLLTMAGMTYVAIMFFIGMLPSIVANILDRRKGKFASRTIIAFNLAGLLKQIVHVFSSGDPNAAAQVVISDPTTWLWVYLFACFGWIVVRILPQLATKFLGLKAEFAVARYKAAQEKLVKEWGEDITK